jgi:hypothetical protein
MDDNPFEDIVIRTDADSVATASAFCTICREDRPLKVTQFTGAIGLACPMCDARKSYRMELLRPAS